MELTSTKKESFERIDSSSYKKSLEIRNSFQMVNFNYKNLNEEFESYGFGSHF